MTKLYEHLLWFMGFPSDMYISDMLARQKERLGSWWWCFPIITLISCVGALALSIWLTIHIATYKLGGVKDA